MAKCNKLSSNFLIEEHEVMKKTGSEVLVKNKNTNKVYLRNVSHLQKIGRNSPNNRAKETMDGKAAYLGSNNKAESAIKYSSGLTSTEDDDSIKQGEEIGTAASMDSEFTNDGEGSNEAHSKDAKSQEAISTHRPRRTITAPRRYM